MATDTADPAAGLKILIGVEINPSSDQLGWIVIDADRIRVDRRLGHTRLESRT